MYYTSKNSWTKHVDFMLIDLAMLFISLMVAFSIRFHTVRPLFNENNYRQLILIFLVSEIVACISLNNLSNVLYRNWRKELISVGLLSLVMASFGTIVLYAARIGVIFSRIFFFCTVCAFFVLDFLARVGWRKIVLLRIESGKKRKPGNRAAIILSDKENYQEVLLQLEQKSLEHFEIRGIALVDGPVEEARYVGNEEEAISFLRHQWIDDVFVYLPTQEIPTDFLNDCKTMGLTVHRVLGDAEAVRKQQFLETFGDELVLTTAYSSVRTYQVIFKRIEDLLGGIIGSAFTLLLVCIIGPIIKIKSPGPIFFKQKRVGRNGKVFEMYKFRSMYPDAEERKKELLEQNRHADGMMFKIDFDPRIIGNEILPDGTHKTGIGEFIRKTSLDEFPQFFNVLKGDMSLVGTRPPTLDEWEKYELHHRTRLVFKPGITGMWQVSGRSDITDFEEVVRLDNEYILNFRILLDVKILFKTALSVFSHKGAM